MKLLARLALPLILSCLGSTPLRADSLADAERKFQAGRERIEFDALNQEEALITGYRKRLEVLKASHQKAGDLASLLGVTAEAKRLAAERAPPPPPADPNSVLGREMASYSAAYGKVQASKADRLGKLAESYRKHLDDTMKTLTREGKIEAAQLYLARIRELPAHVPAPAPPAATTQPEPAPAPAPGPAPPPPVQPARPGKQESPEEAVARFVRDGGLVLRRGTWTKERDLAELAIESTPQGFRLSTPKHPGAHHKLILAGGPLEEGDEVRVRCSGISQLEFVNIADAGSCMSASGPDAGKDVEVIFRRKTSGFSMEINGKTKTGFAKHGQASSDEAAFWADGVCAALSFFDSKNPVVRDIDIRRKRN